MYLPELCAGRWRLTETSNEQEKKSEVVLVKKIVLLFIVVTALILGACDASGAAGKTVNEKSNDEEKDQVTMLLAAAASLEKSFKDQLIPMFIEDNPEVFIEGTYDSSGKLQTQIAEGLEASVFMSAAVKQMNALVDMGRIEPDDVVELLENELVLITAVHSDTQVEGFENVLAAATISIGDPASVPVGQYAEQVFNHLAIWEEVQAKASLATNVTEVLNQVAEGSAEVGVVYRTDAAQIPDKVRVITAAPEGSLGKVIYPVATLKDAPEREVAERFVQFLQSPEAIAVFEANGFTSNVP